MLGNALIDQVGLKNVYHLTDGIVEWKKSGNKNFLLWIKELDKKVIHLHVRLAR